MSLTLVFFHHPPSPKKNPKKKQKMSKFYRTFYIPNIPILGEARDKNMSVKKPPDVHLKKKIAACSLLKKNKERKRSREKNPKNEISA